MENKYLILKDDTIEYYGRTLHRIMALKDFGEVKTGTLGGYIEREYNLSQNGDCWIHDNAKVFDDARVYENASISGNVDICGNAKIYGHAGIYQNVTISGNAMIYGYARVMGRAKIYGKAKIHGNAEIQGEASINENAEIYENAQIKGYAIISVNAKIHGYAQICGDAKICGNAVVCEYYRVASGVVKTDLSKDLKENIRCQTGLGVFNNKVIAYGQVNKDLTDIYDKDCRYVIGITLSTEDLESQEERDKHALKFSNMHYWNNDSNVLNSTFIMAEIDIEDIIDVCYGEIRCKKAKILGKYNINNDDNDNDNNNDEYMKSKRNENSFFIPKVTF